MNSKGALRGLVAVCLVAILVALVGQPSALASSSPGAHPGRTDRAVGRVPAQDYANARFTVFPEWERVEAFDWQLGTTVHLTINPGTDNFEMDATVGHVPWDDPDTAWAQFDFGGMYDVKPGDVVALADGTTTRTHTVQALGITLVNAVEDTVAGTATPNTTFQVWPHENWEAGKPATSDAAGDWQVDFTESFDIVAGTGGRAEIGDPYGNGTAADWSAPNPTFVASLLDNCLVAHDWPIGADLTVSVDDPGTSGVDFTGTTNAVHLPGDGDPGHSWTNYCFYGAIRLEAGQTVVVGDGALIKSLTIVDFSAEADRNLDTMSGSAAPGMDVYVDSWTDPWPSRHVVADSEGNWTADFSVPGGDEAWESSTEDLVAGSHGEARAQDADGDATRLDWSIIWGPPASEVLTLATTAVSGSPSESYGLSIDVWRQIAEPLFFTDETGALVPAGALSYEVDGAGTTYTVHLRPEAKWSDGQPVTAQHFADGLSRAVAENANIYGVISGIQATDATTLEITLAEPAAHFPAVLAHPWSAPLRLELGDHWTNPGSFVGNGPYWLVEWNDLHAILERNPGYHAASKAAVPQMAFVVVPSALQADAYALGDVDVIEASTWAQDDPQLSGRIFVGDPWGTWFIGLNTLRSPTNNALVRAALSAATDRAGMLNAILKSPWLTEATGLVLPGMLGFQAGAGHPFNPADAQALLSAAGYPGGSGLPEIELISNDRHQPVIDYIAAQWRSVLGIEVKTVYYSWPELLDIFGDCDGDTSACTFNAYRLGWGIDYHDSYSMLYEPFCTEGLPCGHGGWSNPDYLTLLASSEQARDPQVRSPRLSAAEELIVDVDSAIIPIYTMRRASVVRSGYYPYFDAWGPLVPMWGTSNLDGDPLHDLVDPCPEDPTNTCDAEGSTAEVVTPEEGGTLTTEDESVTFQVPPAAVDEEIIISITDTDTADDVVLTDDGNISVVVGVEISAAMGGETPPSYDFDKPVTITLAWPDNDPEDGVVDGTVLQEVALVAYQDGVMVAVCAENPNCDTAANTITFTTLHLSVFTLGANQAPTADAGPDQTSDEGSSVVLSAVGSSDPEGDPLTYLWEVVTCSGGLEATLSATDSMAPAFVPNDNGECTLRVTVDDSHPNGTPVPDEAVITVANVVPAISTVSAPYEPQLVNTPISANGAFTDAGSADTHTATWGWGDGSESPGEVVESNGAGSVAGSHAYTDAGVYTVTLSVTDDDGGTATSTFQYVVVYDPSAGFVTGGGWIESSAGAYVPQPELAGRATFGFVARYQKGAHAPTGVTEFQFRVAGLNFRSTSYDWLVVAGRKALYKGIGTINGEGEYRFMLSAIDGDLQGGDGADRFRIRIWDAITEEVIYDNQMDATDDAEPTTAIGGGSIVIHSAK